VKICPTCRQTYTDASLNFCLADGSVLSPLSQDHQSSPTLFMGQTPSTSQSQPLQTNPPQNWGTPAMTSPVRQQKKSKAWIWVLGIFAGFLLLVGLGIVGVIALVATTDFDKKTDNKPTPLPENKFSSNLTDDFSKVNWLKADNNNGKSENRNGEFFVNSKQIGYLYVLVTADKAFKTWNATTTLTARNVNGTPTNLGYGLVIHNNPAVALDKDYAFLIDSTKQSYRIVQHQNKKETVLVKWIKFPAIRSGTQTNEIQVRDEEGKMSLFINGQFANTVNDSVNFKDGVVGVYASDAIPIAFSNLQISK